MIAEATCDLPWEIVTTPHGDVMVCHIPQPKGYEHRAYVACWREASPDEFDGADVVQAGSRDAAVAKLQEEFRRGGDL